MSSDSSLTCGEPHIDDDAMDLRQRAQLAKVVTNGGSSKAALAAREKLSSHHTDAPHGDALQPISVEFVKDPDSNITLVYAV